MKFTQIPTTTFQEIQLNAGILCKSFTPATGTLSSSDIIGATSGGINFTATPTYLDFGDDIDNCPKNTKELKKLDAWDVKMSGTFVTVSTDLADTLVGAGDATDGADTYALTSDTAIVAGKTYYTRTGAGTAESPYVYTPVGSPVSTNLSTYYEITAYGTDKVTPRNDVASSDFKDIWWVGDYSDKNGATNGGFVAIHMLNGLSTGGFQIQSGDKAKGNFGFEFTGHYSISAQDTVPFEVYIKAGTAEPTT